MRSFLKIAGAAALALVVAACGEQSDGQQAAVGQKPSAVPVSVVTARAGTVQLVEAMPGRTVAYRTADVRPQVDGIITKRFFVEGAFVKAGDPLYQIDQEVYVAEVNVAKADLLRQQATLDLARKTRARYEKLRRTQAVSEQAYDDAIAAEAQAEADVAAARARLERAKIDLEYTTVRGPDQRSDRGLRPSMKARWSRPIRAPAWRPSPSLIRSMWMSPRRAAGCCASSRRS